MKKIVYFVCRNQDGSHFGSWIEGTFADGARGLRGEISAIKNAICCGYGDTVEAAKSWAIKNGQNKGVLPKPAPTKAKKPKAFGKVAVYWNSGLEQKTEEFGFSDEANARFQELRKEQEAGRLSVVLAKYLVVDVMFEDGSVYTYFAKLKHRKGSTVWVETTDEFTTKPVKVVKAAYWATREQLELKCPFERFKIAWCDQYHIVSGNDDDD